MTAASLSPADEILAVDLGDRRYDIVIGDGLLDRSAALIGNHMARNRAVIVTDETVGGHYLDRFRSTLVDAGIATDAIVLPPGEETKSFDELQRLTARCFELGVERRDTLIALGGGVIGDLTGFAAAILLRGMDFIQVPTTLLAQVDSSVGGKTAIDVPAGKNLVGAFHQPRLVVIDTATLETLDRRQRLAGYAETVKYGLIGDRDFYDWLEAHGPGVVETNGVERRKAIHAACAAKAGVVARDEKETGERALLNLGHTFAHALETATGYGDRLLHGEAVAIGMCMAFDLSARLGLTHQQDSERVRAHLKAIGLPTRPGDIAGLNLTAAAMISLMSKDKKVTDGRIALILVRGIGDAFLTADVEHEALNTYLESMLA